MVEKFKRSALTERLVKYLSAFDKGADIGYEELSKVTGQRINSRTANLQYAKKLLEVEYRQVWIAIRNTGVHRCSDKEIAERLPSWHMRGARRKLHRGDNQTHVVETKHLDVNEQARFGTHVLQTQLAAQALSRSTYNKIARSARGTSNDLPSFNVLEWALPLTAPKKKKT